MIFFKYTQQPNSLYFLIELFGLSTNQFIFKIGSVVQKTHTFVGLKTGPEVGKKLKRDKEENVANQMAP